MTTATPGGDALGDDRSGTIAAFLDAGLDLLGLQAGEAEIAVIQAADGLYRSLIASLLEAELDGVDPEPGVDVSGPPRALEQR